MVDTSVRYDRYRAFVDLALTGQGHEIASAFRTEDTDRLRSYVPRAKTAWTIAMGAITAAEKRSGIPIRLAESPKLYALDGVAALDAVGLGALPADSALQVFALYYLGVHLFDDIVEDEAKFYSKFAYTQTPPARSDLRASGLSFMIHASCALLDLFEADTEFFDHEAKHELYRFLMGELASALRHFVLEPQLGSTPEDILRIKQHAISGAATSCLAEIFRLSTHCGSQTAAGLKRAFYHLGSLTQFTDDLRDYAEDIASGRPNLLDSLEQAHPTKGCELFVRWYLREEDMMLETLQHLGLLNAPEILCSVPWYPFFIPQEM